MASTEPKIEILSLSVCQQALPERPKNAHKGNFGHVLVVGGDYGMEGAVRLAGEAALRSGAGLVSLATRPEHAVGISAACPELMSVGIQTMTDLERLLEKATVIVVGPGLGQETFGKMLFERVLLSPLPLVVDADALNQLSEINNPHKRENWILTPHPGEAARLLGITTSEVQNNRLKALQMLHARYGGTIVLKGAGTLVMGHEGIPKQCDAGNPGMATAGMGDILSGVIGGLLAQGLSSMDAACLGVCAHATAGDQVAKQGQRGMMARDLLESIRLCLNPHS